MTGVPQRRGRVHQAREIVAGRKPERVAGFETTAAGDVVQEAAKPTVHNCPLVAFRPLSLCFFFFRQPGFLAAVCDYPLIFFSSPMHHGETGYWRAEIGNPVAAQA